ncbi:18602_t:CDS:2, partial [Gigaspora rosea]
VIDTNISSKEFRINLAWDLTKNTLRREREACVYCRYLSQRGEREINPDNPPQSNLWCAKYKVPLCSSKPMT